MQTGDPHHRVDHPILPHERCGQCFSRPSNLVITTVIFGSDESGAGEIGRNGQAVFLHVKHALGQRYHTFTGAVKDIDHIGFVSCPGLSEHSGYVTRVLRWFDWYVHAVTVGGWVSGQV